MAASDVLAQFLKRSASHTAEDADVLVSFRGLRGEVGNRDRVTHLVHWYPAKMFYRIPEQILDTLSLNSTATLLDPFCGSGTVLVEGILRGYTTTGIDVNPIARMISRAKTTPLDAGWISKHAKTIVDRAKHYRSVPHEEQVPSYWFGREIGKALHRLHRAIMEVRDDQYRNFFSVCLTSIVRRCSLADPSIAPPVRMTAKRAPRAGNRYQRAFAAAIALTGRDVYDRFIAAVSENCVRLIELSSHDQLGKAVVLDASASNTGLKPRSVDLIITSPPYCGAQKYVRSLRLEMRLLGMSDEAISAVDRLTLGTERILTTGFCWQKFEMVPSPILGIAHKVFQNNQGRGIMLAHYFKGLLEFAQECKRVLKPGGNAFVSFGTSRIAGQTVDLARIFTAIGRSIGLNPFITLVDTIPSRGLITKRHRTSSTIEQENVVWLVA
jgi:SAM-dependent methyltransferase